MDHKINRLGKLGVASSVVVVCVRVNNCRDWIVGDTRDQVENVSAVTLEFRIHKRDPDSRNEHGRIPTGLHTWNSRIIGKHVQVRSHLPDTVNFRSGLACLIGRDSQTHAEQRQTD